jgi:PAS domain S-box-containing protein
MSSVEQSADRESALGVEGIARLDVVLRQSELEWRHITDAIAVNVVVQSPTGTCLFANRTALEYWGLKLEDVMVANYRAPVHPDDAAQMYAKRQEGLAKGVPFENELRSRRHDGEYRLRRLDRGARSIVTRAVFSML